MAGHGGLPAPTGLYRPLVQAKTWTVDPGAWAQARDEGEVIGRCRQRGCDGYLVVDDPPTYGTADLGWFVARCQTCTAEVAAPHGRVVKSGAHSEAPEFWAKRKDLLRRT